MGAWSVSINGNDTAQDLLGEYTVAFWHYKDVNIAVSKIEEYVRDTGIDESDTIGWCDYVYSLADYMWRKGILTDEIKQRALTMIQNDFGMEEWQESGEKVLLKRKKVLSAFREKLLSPMPPMKKIKPNAYTETIFTNGDIIAVQLQTEGKPYTQSKEKSMTDDEFHALDGKYIIMQKIKDHSSWQSSIVPDVHDYYAVFRLFDGVFDEIPSLAEISSLKDAQIKGLKRLTPFFCCESSMFYFKKRKYVLIGNDAKSAKRYCDYFNICHELESVFLGINKPWYNPDSELLCAMGKEVVCQEYNGSLDALEGIIHSSICHENKYDPHLSREENEAIELKKTKSMMTELERLIADGCRIYTVQFGVTAGAAFLHRGKVEYLFIHARYCKLGFDNVLLRYVKEYAENAQ